MQELVAVAALLVSGLDSREAATAGYATACLHNLKRQPAVLDALRLGGATRTGDSCIKSPQKMS